jgi:hypothetical protein
MSCINLSNYIELSITSNSITACPIENYGKIITFKSSNNNDISLVANDDDPVFNNIITNYSDILTINIDSIMQGKYEFINKSSNANVTINISQELVPDNFKNLTITFSESTPSSTTVNGTQIKDFTQDTTIHGINVRYCQDPNQCTT